MRKFVRPTLLEQCGLLTLIAGYAALWIGGSVWHTLTCCGRSHGTAWDQKAACCQKTVCYRDTECSLKAYSTTCQGDHGSDRCQSKRTTSSLPIEPEHSEDDCQVCQCFAQTHSGQQVAIVLVGEPFIASALEISVKTPRNKFPFRYRSRAPPASL